jgi:TfoX/Sxy family transcriptional regulator of competence genes
MAYDEQLARRVRESFAAQGVSVEEKPMMGGLCFMVNGKMCVGVDKQRLMARIDPEQYVNALSRKGCTPMDFTGRPMRGFVFVNPEGTKSQKELESWIALALEFNPRAVASKRKQNLKAQPGVEVSRPKQQSRSTSRKRKK